MLVCDVHALNGVLFIFANCIARGGSAPSHGGSAPQRFYDRTWRFYGLVV